MPTTLDFYWGLASLDESKRLEAAAQLISTLCKFQAEMPTTEGELAMTEEDMDRICAGDVSYAMRRLIKGLGSSRNGARQGFSVALAELLGRIECISVKLVLDLLWKNTEATNGMKGQEQRDMRFGRIFGLMALVQSGIIPARAGTTPVEIRKIVMELAGVGTKKSYLREIAYTTLGAMVPKLRGFSFSEELVSMLVSVALDNGAIGTPDELLLALRLRRAYPGHNWPQALPQWRGAHMLSAKNVTKVAAILCGGSDAGVSAAPGWQPQLHSVWDEIFELYFDRARAYEVESQKPMEFETLWDATVENGMFAAGSSQFRRYWGFLLLERLLPFLSEDTIPALMTPNIVRALSDNISLSGKSLLAAVGLRTMEKLVAVCEGNTKVGLAVLTHLLNQKSAISGPGKNSTSLRSLMADRIVAKLDGAAITGYVNYLQKIFLQPRRTHSGAKDGVADLKHAANLGDKSLERQRFWAIDQMIRVARFAQLPITDELTTNVLRFVIAQAAFKTVVGKSKSMKELATPPVPPLIASARDHCSLALINLIGDLNRQPPQGQEGPGCSRAGVLWARTAIEVLLEGAQHESEVALHGFNETRPVLESAFATLKAMETRTMKTEAVDGDTQRVRMLSLLLGNLSVMAGFSAEPHVRAEYTEAIPEVIECYEKYAQQLDGKSKAQKKKRKTRSATAAEESEEPQPAEVLTDMLIGFLTRDSVILRRLCEQVFATFTELMTPAAIGAICGVLSAKEGEGEDAAVETQMDAMDLDDDEADEAADSDEDAEMGDEDMDEELRRKIQEALANGAEREEPASASGEEEEYDDEQMTMFDDKLTEIFRHKKEQKAAARNMKISMVHFKLRVLDLADAFLAKQPESPLVIQLLPVIVTLAKFTRKGSRNRPIHDRAVSILSQRRARYPAGFDVDNAQELLANIHEWARRAQDKHDLRMFTNVAAFMTRTLLDNAQGATLKRQRAVADGIRELNQASVADFMTRKASQIHVDFFKPATEKLLPTQLEPFWRIALATLENYARPLKAVNVYRQVQAYALAESLLISSARVSAAESGLSPKQLAPFVDLAGKLVAELCAALQDTLVYVVSEENKNATTGKELVDAKRLYEIVKHAMDFIRRLGKIEAFRPTVAKALPTGDAWDGAITAVEQSPSLFTNAIKSVFVTLRDLERLVKEPKKA
ncbi:DNA-directed DNA polymerase [Coemansia sp. RSA 552]|nr:DNA-directed DNA polymerase [Coemansia sp. RSA 552]